MAQVWLKCGSSMAQLWFKCGSIVAQVWLKCGSSLAQVWLTYGLIELLSGHATFRDYNAHLSPSTTQSQNGYMYTRLQISVKCGSSVAQLWLKRGSSVAQVWLKCGSSMDQMHLFHALFNTLFRYFSTQVKPGPGDGKSIP